MNNYQRKQDTRYKIELGGLVVKAKLGYLHENNKDVILGILADAYNKIQSIESEHHLNYYIEIGERAFGAAMKDETN